MLKKIFPVLASILVASPILAVKIQVLCPMATYTHPQPYKNAAVFAAITGTNRGTVHYYKTNSQGIFHLHKKYLNKKLALSMVLPNTKEVIPGCTALAITIKPGLNVISFQKSALTLDCGPINLVCQKNQ